MVELFCRNNPTNGSYDLEYLVTSFLYVLQTLTLKTHKIKADDLDVNLFTFTVCNQSKRSGSMYNDILYIKHGKFYDQTIYTKPI